MAGGCVVVVDNVHYLILQALHQVLGRENVEAEIVPNSDVLAVRWRQHFPMQGVEDMQGL